MVKIRSRGEDIRKFILDRVDKHATDINKITANHFAITRQAVHKHLKKLTIQHALIESGHTRNRRYTLAPLLEWKQTYKITPNVAEDLVWKDDIRKILGDMPENILSIWHYGFTEMFNNALDHSDGSKIIIEIKKTAASTEIVIRDNGLGIFKKIQTTLNLLDERHALLELSKGKLTTDPKHHSGEGIFFTSRMFDSYNILSGEVYFSHQFGQLEDWIIERDHFKSGTAVWMKLHNHTARSIKKIFDHYTSGGDYRFSKTVVPVNLARYGSDKLISRSQAKRLLARVELFKTVIFDFTEVDSIGQAFADEIFRVFAIHHPKIELRSIHTSAEVKRMIERAESEIPHKRRTLI